MNFFFQVGKLDIFLRSQKLETLKLSVKKTYKRITVAFGDSSTGFSPCRHVLSADFSLVVRRIAHEYFKHETERPKCPCVMAAGRTQYLYGCTRPYLTSVVLHRGNPLPSPSMQHIYRLDEARMGFAIFGNRKANIKIGVDMPEEFYPPPDTQSSG